MKTKKVLASLLSIATLGTIVAVHVNSANAQTPHQIRNYTIHGLTIKFNNTSDIPANSTLHAVFTACASGSSQHLSIPPQDFSNVHSGSTYQALQNLHVSDGCSISMTLSDSHNVNHGHVIVSLVSPFLDAPAGTTKLITRNNSGIGGSSEFQVVLDVTVDN